MTQSVRTIVVFETRPRWQPELQRQFVDQPVRVQGCRNWNELSALAFPSSVKRAGDRRLARTAAVDAIVIELPDDAAPCLQWLSSLTVQELVPPIIVLLPSEAAELEWPLRDAGVHDVLVGELAGERLARCLRRSLFELEATVRTCQPFPPP